MYEIIKSNGHKNIMIDHERLGKIGIAIVTDDIAVDIMVALANSGESRIKELTDQRDKLLLDQSQAAKAANICAELVYGMRSDPAFIDDSHARWALACASDAIKKRFNLLPPGPEGPPRTHPDIIRVA